MPRIVISYQGQEHVQEEPPSEMSEANSADKGLSPDFRVLLSRTEEEYAVTVLRPLLSGTLS